MLLTYHDVRVKSTIFFTKMSSVGTPLFFQYRQIDEVFAFFHKYCYSSIRKNRNALESKTTPAGLRAGIPVIPVEIPVGIAVDFVLYLVQ